MKSILSTILYIYEIYLGIIQRGVLVNVKLPQEEGI